MEYRVTGVADRGESDRLIVSKISRAGWIAPFLNATHESIQWLVSIGADIDARDVYGQTLLFIMCTKGHADTVRVLLGMGAKLTPDKYGETPLIASVNKDGLTLEVMLRYSAGSVDDRDGNGETALAMACRLHFPKSVKLLLQAGADPTLPRASNRFDFRLDDEDSACGAQLREWWREYTFHLSRKKCYERKQPANVEEGWVASVVAGHVMSELKAELFVELMELWSPLSTQKPIDLEIDNLDKWPSL
jgi:hypothetical protein